MAGLRLSTETLAVPRLGLWRRWVDWARRPGPQPSAAIPSHTLGEVGEALAARALQQLGYTILGRNYRQPGLKGELDIIARDPGSEGRLPAFVFVEVKTRSRAGKHPTEFSVNLRKRRALIVVARAFRRERRLRGAYRFDLVVVHDPEGLKPEIKHHRWVFEDRNQRRWDV